MASTLEEKNMLLKKQIVSFKSRPPLERSVCVCVCVGGGGVGGRKQENLNGRITPPESVPSPKSLKDNIPTTDHNISNENLILHS